MCMARDVDFISIYIGSWFSDLDHSLNRKGKRFKVFEVEPGLNRDDVIINLIIILNINKYINLVQKKFTKIVQLKV